MGRVASYQYSHEELEALVIAASSGDQCAFEQLYKVTWKQIYYLLLGKRINDEDVKEILQEVYIKVYSSIGELENPRVFIAWLNTITHNTYISYLRKNNLDIVDTDISELPDFFVYDYDEFLPEQILEQKEICEQVLDIVNELPEQQRLAIIMHYYEDLTPREISEITLTSENAVYKRLHDGKNTIKAKVAALEKKVVVLRSMASPLVLSEIFKRFAANRIGQEVGDEALKAIITAIGVTVPTVVVANTALTIAKLAVVKFGAVAAGVAVVAGGAIYSKQNDGFEQGNSQSMSAVSQVSTQTPQSADSGVEPEPNVSEYVYYDDGEANDDSPDPGQGPSQIDINAFNLWGDVSSEGSTQTGEPQDPEKTPIPENEIKPEVTQTPPPTQTPVPTQTPAPITKPQNYTDINEMLENMELRYNIGQNVTTEEFLRRVSEETGNAFDPTKAKVVGYTGVIPMNELGAMTVTVVSTEPNLPFEGEVSVDIVDDEAPKVTILKQRIFTNKNTVMSEDALITAAGVTATDNSGQAEIIMEGYEDIKFDKKGQYSVSVKAEDRYDNASFEKLIIVEIK